MEKDYGYVFNILMIGDSGVGKTSILKQYKDKKFSFSKVATLGVDFCIKRHEIGSNDVKLQVWDTCGQERFRAIIRSYYHRADAVVVVYDIGCAETFNHVPYWLREVKDYAEEGVHCLLVGNKSDLPDKRDTRGKSAQKGTLERKIVQVREVTTESGEHFAEENGMPFVESTARNWDNINQLFVHLAKTLLDKKPTPHEEASDIEEASDMQGGSDVQEESGVQEAHCIQESSAMLESNTVDINECKNLKKRHKKCC